MIETITKTVFVYDGKEYDTMEEAEYKVAYNRVHNEILSLKEYSDDIGGKCLETDTVVEYILQNYTRKV